MRDPKTGQVEAVCGVDYPAETWIARIAGARREAIAFVAVLVALTGAAGVVASLQRARVIELRLRIAERERATDALAAAKEQADAANVAKSAFLANMSHELRTPLTAVLGFADLLREPDISKEQRLDWAGTIRRNGNHLLNVINDILDLSKIEAGKLSLETMSVSPAHVVEEVASLMRVRASDKGLSLRVHAPPDMLPPRVLLDPTRLRQILMNLVGNAIKFTQSGSVTIVAKFAAGDASRGVMTFDVIDTGIGMAADVVDRLFQPFEQADVSTTRKYGGTGLGLTISRRLADLMGGTVRVKSTQGSGSTFTLEVPVQLAPAEYGGALVTPTSRHAAASVRLDGVRVLLAEDSAENARLIAYHLEAGGAEYIALAGNGVEAYRAIAAAQASRPFDVVLMDMQMPTMDGYEATRQVRQMGFTGAIVALTANAMGGDKEKCLAAGCDDYAVKPIDAPRLIELIRRHADRIAGPKPLKRSA
jgi:signal transduction histidine kinase/ActR/RegA family two-component response regulator